MFLQKCFLTFWLNKYLYLLIIIRDNILPFTRLNCFIFLGGGVLKYPPNIITNVILMVRILACGMIPRELILVSLPLINLLSLNGAVFFPIWNPSTEIKNLNYIDALSRFTRITEFSKILVFVVNSSSNSRIYGQQCAFSMLSNN